jgi:hypothetical protein
MESNVNLTRSIDIDCEIFIFSCFYGFTLLEQIKCSYYTISDTPFAIVKTGL